MILGVAVFATVGVSLAYTQTAGTTGSTSQGHPFQIGSLFGMEHSGMMHKSHMGGAAWKSQQPSTTSPPTGTQ